MLCYKFYLNDDLILCGLFFGKQKETMNFAHCVKFFPFCCSTFPVRYSIFVFVLIEGDEINWLFELILVTFPCLSVLGRSPLGVFARYVRRLHTFPLLINTTQRIYLWIIYLALSCRTYWWERLLAWWLYFLDGHIIRSLPITLALLKELSEMGEQPFQKESGYFL